MEKRMAKAARDGSMRQGIRDRRRRSRSDQTSVGRMSMRQPERFETIIIGGGQAGLAMGYHLARRGRPFVILEAGAQVGDSWRHRWDSLRLFSPARYDGLPGMPYPALSWSFPTHEEFADYLR